MHAHFVQIFASKLQRMGKDWGGEKRTWKFHRMILDGIIATFSGYDVPHAYPFCKENHFFLNIICLNDPHQYLMILMEQY